MGKLYQPVTCMHAKPKTVLWVALEHLKATTASLNRAAQNLEAATASLRSQTEAIDQALAGCPKTRPESQT